MPITPTQGKEKSLNQTGQAASAMLQKLRDKYKESNRNPTFNALIYGDSGMGKTKLLETCRKPVLVHSFDPGGLTTIRDSIASGSIIADESFEVKNKEVTDTFRRWEKEIVTLKKASVFEKVGTFSLDSITLWFDAIQTEIKRINGIDQLRIQDWGVLYSTVRDWINYLCALPCDVIITGHIDLDKDEITGKNETTLLLQGASKKKLPIFFDEVYVALTRKTAKGLDYKLLTKNDGYYKAKTRLGSNGCLDTYEDPDIKKILKKVGYKTDDLM